MSERSTPLDGQTAQSYRAEREPLPTFDTWVERQPHLEDHSRTPITRDKMYLADVARKAWEMGAIVERARLSIAASETEEPVIRGTLDVSKMKFEGPLSDKSESK